MKKEMIGKRSAVSTVNAIFTMFMLTAVMTLAGTFTVFADDTVPDQGQSVSRIRDVSKKQEVTFRGSGTPDLSEFGSEGGSMYPYNDPDPGNNEPPGGPASEGIEDGNDNHEIDNASSGDLNVELNEESQLSSGPVNEDGDNKLPGPGVEPNGSDDAQSPGSKPVVTEQPSVTEKTAPETTQTPTAVTTPLKAVKTVTVNSATVSAATLDAAVKKAGGSKSTVTTIILGRNVRKISKSAFRNCRNAKTLVIKTKKLKKATVRKSLKGSEISNVKVKAGNKKTNNRYVKKYMKIFTGKNAGKKVTVSL